MKRVIGVILAIVLLFGFFIVRCSIIAPTKLYVVARDPTWRPLMLLDKEASMTAFTNELLAGIAVEEGIRVDTVSGNSDTLFQGLDNFAYDGILTSLVPSPNNANRYIISDNYFLLGPVVIVKENSTINSITQLNNKTVGVLRGSSNVFEIAQYPTINIISYDSAVDAIENLIKKNIDAVIMDTLPAHSYSMKFYAGEIKVATPPLTKKGIHLITRKDPVSMKLMEAFNEGLKKVREDGTYDELLKRWELSTPDNTPEPTDKINNRQR